MSSGISSAFASLISQQANNVSVDITIDGVDLTDAIDPSLIEVSYKQSFDSESKGDELTIMIADPQGLFRQQFNFTPQLSVTCTFTINNWSDGNYTPNVLQKVINNMWIKRVKMRGSKGGGTTIQIICSSIPPQSPLRLQRNTASYPAPGASPTTLKTLAQLIANQDGLTGGVIMNAPDVQIARVDQTNHSDLYLLHRLCSENDYYFKVVNNTIYITDMKTIDQIPSLGTIFCPSPTNGAGGWQGSGITEWEFSAETEDTLYSTATNPIFDSTSGQTVIGTASDNNVPNGPNLNIHLEPDSGLPTEEGFDITPIVPND